MAIEKSGGQSAFSQSVEPLNTHSGNEFVKNLPPAAIFLVSALVIAKLFEGKRRLD